MSTQYLIRRDTSAWQLQVWLSFVLAVAACAVGVWNMPSESLDRAFLAIGYFFCLFTAFTLAKLLRDNRDEKVDTGAWALTVWAAFAIAVALTAWGLFRMTIDVWQKSYMLVSWIYLISAVFTLAKTVRDKHEADLLESGAALDQPTLAVQGARP
ncbi:YiaA/YiaB family inner membrane protein [Jeongeupia wiesaeckerbachi]|uniref:YiaA/YiaB family inner membrane protein n=1 Tax=Jeongeupia wiesaeckerbachi TaxID=3051218 RepID=UPI003D805357